MAHILLLEPDMVLAETYRACLVNAGHTVTACSGAQAAILAADQQRPDAVVLELQLVEHSGIEFLYEFRSYPEWQALPVIIQSYVPSGEFNGTWRMLTDQLGVGAYLYKPTSSLAELLHQVERVQAQSSTVAAVSAL